MYMQEAKTTNIVKQVCQEDKSGRVSKTFRGQ